MTTHALRHPAALASSRTTAAALFHFTIEHFLLLPIGGGIAIVWANTRPESYFTLAHALSFVVNEVGMALFFALITQEIVEEVMPGGALHTWKRWTLPAVAAVGGTVGAAAVYLAYVGFKYEIVLSPGWPVAGAIDIAFAYFIVKAIFRRHAAIPFLLLTAIAADALGMLAIAGRQAFVEVRPGGAALMAAAVGLAFMFRQVKTRTFWPYLAICGPLAWWALYLDGFHPALALVPIVPFLPHVPRSLDAFAETPDRRHDSVRHFEHLSQYPVQAVLFLFGVVNAGVLLSGYGTGTWALLAAAAVGKPLGILAATGAAVALGLHLPLGLHWRDLVVVALATAGGFTFGLFFATAVFPVGPILAELKIGAVATGIGVPLAFVAARLLQVGRFGRHRHRAPSARRER
jgi:NhaA family Na+:H+ antiporter